ncbi:MAG: nucleotidyl transferase AbiEii/AbiGii toxin family protein [Nitrososphaerales archaeon]
MPAGIKKCTVAMIKEYKQTFKQGDVESRFYITVSNTLLSEKYEMRKPKSYIGIEYVKKEIPVLPPVTMIASKIKIIPIRKVKDVYKDIFDIHALLKFGDSRVKESDIVDVLTKSGSKIKKSELFQKFKVTSGIDGAKNAIKLPALSKEKYLNEWNPIHRHVKELVVKLLEQAKMLQC